MLTCIFFALFFSISQWALVVEGRNHHVVHADVVIAGGSLSALAAAITAANVSRSRELSPTIVLLEPTDWPGGQLTASNVPPDFGNENSVPENLPASFVSLLMAVAGPSWEDNPGNCWVSYKCFQANYAADFIKKNLEEFAPNLHVYYNTVVKKAIRDGDGNVNRIEAIQRFPIENSTGWGKMFSESVEDWYSVDDSLDFRKVLLTFEDIVVAVEATEFSDILVTSGMDFIQGVEYPDEVKFVFFPSFFPQFAIF
jgi:hypothetical protein